MESILVIDSIDVKKYGIDDDADKEVDDGRPPISLSASSSSYENLYFGHTKKKRAQNMEKKSSIENDVMYDVCRIEAMSAHK